MHETLAADPSGHRSFPLLSHAVVGAGDEDLGDSNSVPSGEVIAPFDGEGQVGGGFVLGVGVFEVGAAFAGEMRNSVADRGRGAGGPFDEIENCVSIGVSKVAGDQRIGGVGAEVGLLPNGVRRQGESGADALRGGDIGEGVGVRCGLSSSIHRECADDVTRLRRDREGLAASGWHGHTARRIDAAIGSCTGTDELLGGHKTRHEIGFDLLPLCGAEGDLIDKHIANVAVECGPSIWVVAPDVERVGIGARDIRHERGHGARAGDVHDLCAVGEDFELSSRLHHEAEDCRLAIRDGIGGAASGEGAVAPHIYLSGAVADAEHQTIVEEIDDGGPARARAVALWFGCYHDGRAIDRDGAAVGALAKAVAIGIRLPDPLHAVEHFHDGRAHHRQRLA